MIHRAIKNIYFQDFIQSHKVVTPLVKIQITKRRIILIGALDRVGTLRVVGNSERDRNGESCRNYRNSRHRERRWNS